MKSKLFFAWIAGGLLFFSGARMFAETQLGSDQQGGPKGPTLMLAKLSSTQRIVSGLVSKNFGEIKRGAEEMIRICEASQWESHPDPVYGHHKKELRRQSLKLIEMADGQNLDGAAFNYMQTLSTCISCHSHCRDILRLAVDVPHPSNGVFPIPVTEEEANRARTQVYRR